MVILFLAACEKQVVTEAGLLAYVQDKDNGLIQEKEKNSYKVRVLIKPTDLLVAQSIQGPISKKELQTLRNNYSNYQYFLLSLSHNQKNALYGMRSGYGQFSEMLQTLAFRMDEYVQLITANKDTIPVADFIYPRLYGASPSTDVLFVFNSKNVHRARWVQFTIEEFGLGVGRQKFRFNTRDIVNAPEIKFKIVE